MAENDPAPTSTSNQNGGWGTLRYIGALSVPLVALVAWRFGGLDTCSGQGATPVCTLIAPTSLPALAGLLLVVLLLFPDLSEATVAQVFSVKRRVNSHEQRLDAQESRLAQLFAMSASSNASVVNYVSQFLHPEETKEVEARLPEGLWARVAQSVGNDNAEARKLALIELNERLVRLSGAVRAGEVPLPHNWSLADFQGIVDVVRKARNNVAHGFPIEDADVKRALAMGRALETGTGA